MLFHFTTPDGFKITATKFMIFYVRTHRHQAVLNSYYSITCIKYAYLLQYNFLKIDGYTTKRIPRSQIPNNKIKKEMELANLIISGFIL
jgi:hypothetical protein